MLFLFTLLGLLLPSQVGGWVVLSRHSTQLALDGIFDLGGQKLMTLGVLFRTAYKDLTLQGSSDTDCYVAVGDVRGFDRAIFETPQMCTQFRVMPRMANGELNPLLPQGIITGIHGNRATVSGLDYYGEYDEATRRDTIDLPAKTYPVAVETDAATGGVFVGLHGTGGILPPSAPQDDKQVLFDTNQYVYLMTHPTQTTHMLSPSIVKVNITTGETLWTLPLETTEGRSTIGGIKYLASRDILVVAGSSNGQGNTVGAGTFTNSWDGFLTLVDPSSGGVDQLPPEASVFTAEHSIRVSSQVDKDDYILGICFSGDEVYIVGTTTGRMTTEAEQDGGGFIVKVDIDTLNIGWKYQWDGVGTEALKCRVSQDKVYVAGHVPGDVLLKEDTRRSQPSPDQDIFVSMHSRSTGDQIWTKQTDSRRPDRLADIVLDFSGNIIVIGNAMDFDNGVSDIYTFSVDPENGFYDWEDLPSEALPIQGATNAGDGSTLPPEIISESNNDDNDPTVVLVATLVPLAVIMLVVVAASAIKKSPAEVPGENSPATNGNKPPEDTPSDSREAAPSSTNNSNTVV